MNSLRFTLWSLFALWCFPASAFEKCFVESQPAPAGGVICFLPRTNTELFCPGSTDAPTPKCEGRLGEPATCEVRGNELWCSIGGSVIPSTPEGVKIPARTLVITNESLQAARPAQNYVPAPRRIQRTTLAENIDAARERHNAPLMNDPFAELDARSDPFREASRQPLTNDPFAELDRRDAQLLSQSNAAQPLENITSEHRSAARRETIFDAMAKGVIVGIVFVTLAVIVGLVRQIPLPDLAQRRKLVMQASTAFGEFAVWLPALFSLALLAAVVGILGFGAWALFSPHSVDYYLSDTEARIRKIEQCARDRSFESTECKNASVAVRVLRPR